MIYTPAEIAKKFSDLKPTTITDLAVKGIIKPYKEPANQGSPRLYDRQNIRDICIALSLRGIVHGEALKRVIDEIKTVNMDDIDILSVSHVADMKDDIMVVAYPKDRGESLSGFVPSGEDCQGKRSTKSFMSVMIDLQAIDEFIQENFV
jgi:hypothetical protein